MGMIRGKRVIGRTAANFLIYLFIATKQDESRVGIQIFKAFYWNQLNEGSVVFCKRVRGDPRWVGHLTCSGAWLVPQSIRYLPSLYI